MASAAASASARELALEALPRLGQPEELRRAVEESSALAAWSPAVLQLPERLLPLQRVLLLPLAEAQTARRPAARQPPLDSILVLSRESEAGAAERLGARPPQQALQVQVSEQQVPLLAARRAVAEEAALASQPALPSLL
jgi:hypothetical protein